MAVTAPQAAIPPAMKDLISGTSLSFQLLDRVYEGLPCSSRHYTRRRREGSEVNLHPITSSQGDSGNLNLRFIVKIDETISVRSKTSAMCNTFISPETNIVLSS